MQHIHKMHFYFTFVQPQLDAESTSGANSGANPTKFHVDFEFELHLLRNLQNQLVFNVLLTKKLQTTIFFKKQKDNIFQSFQKFITSLKCHKKAYSTAQKSILTICSKRNKHFGVNKYSISYFYFYHF